MCPFWSFCYSTNSKSKNGFSRFYFCDTPQHTQWHYLKCLPPWIILILIEHIHFSMQGWSFRCRGCDRQVCFSSWCTGKPVSGRFLVWSSLKMAVARSDSVRVQAMDLARLRWDRAQWYLRWKIVWYTLGLVCRLLCRLALAVVSIDVSWPSQYFDNCFPTGIREPSISVSSRCLVVDLITIATTIGGVVLCVFLQLNASNQSDVGRNSCMPCFELRWECEVNRWNCWLARMRHQSKWNLSTQLVWQRINLLPWILQKRKELVTCKQA